MGVRGILAFTPERLPSIDSYGTVEKSPALFAAYFTEGKDLGVTKVLADIAASAGLDQAKVEKLLNSEEGAEAVRALEEGAYNHGISGVPHFIFGEEGEISGAQPTEVFTSILAQLKS